MNIKNTKKPETRIDVRYLSSLGIKTYGADNLYPQELHDIVSASSCGRTCLERRITYIEGNGLASQSLSDFICNTGGETVDDVHSLLSADCGEYEGIAIHVNYNIAGNIVSLAQMPFECVRLEEEDEHGIISHVIFHPDWRGKKTRNGKSVKVDNAAGLLTFPADYFISSMPLAELAEALDDGLNLRQLTIARGLPYRDFITVGLLVDKLLPPNKTRIKTLGDIVPDCWIYVQEPSVKLGRLQIFNNWSPYMVVDPQNSVWLGLEYFCNEGDDLWQMSEEDFIKFATEELASIGIIDAGSVRFGVQVKVPKAYPAYFDTYENIDELRAALDDIKNLYCIGRNGQHRYNNMDHSMLTSVAAVCALAGKFTKAAVWNINAEQTYHEEKTDA